MRITLNGESKEVAPDLSVGSLLQQLELQPDRVAVEINLSILDRSKFTTWTLQEGDRIEIISFIGGGSPRHPVHCE
ncbi:MAG: sulfur carrier protein ThiS [Nitrospirales bacterium]|nr:sulfur carrier protein ThiS [Nitrospirales bacterium]